METLLFYTLFHKLPENTGFSFILTETVSDPKTFEFFHTYNP